jgi:hypothetical protein
LIKGEKDIRRNGFVSWGSFRQEGRDIVVPTREDAPSVIWPEGGTEWRHPDGVAESLPPGSGMFRGLSLEGTNDDPL